MPETFAKILWNRRISLPTSFPRRRESMFEFHNRLNKKGFLRFLLDSRLRGNDVTFVSSSPKNFFAKVSACLKNIFSDRHSYP